MTIFGMKFEDILKFQQKDIRHKLVDLTQPSKSQPTDKDIALLKEHGLKGLQDLQFFGVIDRLGL